MERELAEEFIRELLAMGNHLNRLYELIHTHVAGDDLQKEFRRSLGAAMDGAAVMTLQIARMHPDLDPDKQA
jgi:hypothetical protein